MKNSATSSVITLSFEPEELELLARLAGDQLFRREYIDSRIPGFRHDAEELRLGKALVERIQSTVRPGSGKKVNPARAAG
jgi:hypothetical protein